MCERVTLVSSRVALAFLKTNLHTLYSTPSRDRELFNDSIILMSQELPVFIYSGHDVTR